MERVEKGIAKAIHAPVIPGSILPPNGDVPRASLLSNRPLEAAKAIREIGLCTMLLEGMPTRVRARATEER